MSMELIFSSNLLEAARRRLQPSPFFNTLGTAEQPCRSNELVLPLDHFFARFSILAHVSRKPIVRLNTGFSGTEAGST
jgi:hypothetical protein